MRTASWAFLAPEVLGMRVQDLGMWVRMFSWPASGSTRRTATVINLRAAGVHDGRDQGVGRILARPEKQTARKHAAADEKRV